MEDAYDVFVTRENNEWVISEFVPFVDNKRQINITTHNNNMLWIATIYCDEPTTKMFKVVENNWEHECNGRVILGCNMRLVQKGLPPASRSVLNYNR